MKIYISVDMEGATGVVHREQLTSDGKDYERARKLLTGDVNAAIEGALEGGATELLVNDSHASMRNILLEDLHEAARLILGPAQWTQKPLCQVQEVDASFDLAFFVAYHSRAGTKPGLLSHTWVGAVIHEARLNGQVAGETRINAAVLGHHGVPVALVAGADCVCREASGDLPWAETVATKKTLGWSAAACLPPSRTRTLIREAARRAVERRAEMKPLLLDPPVTMEITTHRREMADRAAEAPGIERTGERTIATTAPDAPTAVARMWRSMEMALREDAAFLK